MGSVHRAELTRREPATSPNKAVQRTVFFAFLNSSKKTLVEENIHIKYF